MACKHCSDCKKRKKDTWQNEPCRDLSHNPPSMIVLPPGTHTHICPSCGFETIFTVPSVSL